MSIFSRRLCLYIMFDVLDPNFAVNLQTGPTTLPTRILKNGYKLVKNSQIELKSCIQVDFDLWNHLLLFKCEWNVCKVPRSGLIFDEKRAKLVKIWKSEISGFRPHQRDSFTSKTIDLHICWDLKSIFGHFEPFLAKNGLKWLKISIFFKLIVVIWNFLPISLIPLRTRKNILIRTFEHLHRGHNRPKTGQKWLKSAWSSNWSLLFGFFCQSFSF